MKRGSTSLLILACALLVFSASRDRPAALPRAPQPDVPITWRAAHVADPDDPQDRAAIVQLTMQADGSGHAASDAGIRYTSDGGRTWTPGGAPDADPTSVAVQENDFLLISSEDGAVFRSTNAGHDWQLIERLAQRINRLAVVAPDTIFAAGFQALLRSCDGGATWQRLDVPPQDWYDIAFASHREGYVVGGAGQLLRTGDGGGTWTLSTLPTRALLYGVAAADQTTVIAVGTDGTIVRTEDGGRTWQRVPSGTVQHLRDVAFRDGRVGVAVGHFGAVVTTSDGGRTWKRENAGTQAHLLSVAFAPDLTPVVAGWFDTILRGSAANPARTDP